MVTNAEKQFIWSERPPFASCHASHLTLLPDGGVLAVWFAGSAEGADDVAIWSSRRENGVWSPPEIAAAEPGLTHWNPVLMTREDGAVLLYYKVGKLIKDWYTKLKVSTDQGKTWSEPSELVPGDRGGRGPVRNKVIRLSDGAWLAPGSTEDGIWRAFADRSEDQGRTWTKSGEIGISGLVYENGGRVQSDIPVSEQSFHGRGVIQPTLWESQPGRVHMLLRSSEGFIFRSDSEDGGCNWTEAYPTALPNNNSGIDVVRLADGTLALVYNPVGVNWGPRSPLSIAFSRDNGATWSEPYDLEREEGEYSYPAIVSDGRDLYLTYTWRRENIAFWKITV